MKKARDLPVALAGFKQSVRVETEDAILDTEGVMKLLKVSRRSLQTWRDQGLIEFSAIQKKFYYRMSAINKMLDKHLKKEEDL